MYLVDQKTGKTYLEIKDTAPKFKLLIGRLSIFFGIAEKNVGELGDKSEEMIQNAEQIGKNKTP